MLSFDTKHLGGMAETYTTDALVEMLHKLYESTDVKCVVARELFLDYNTLLDLITMIYIIK